MGTYSTRRGRPLGVSEQGAGATLTNMNLFALDGESEIVSVHDDFNGYVMDEHFGGANNWETQGWALTDAGTTTTPVADFMSMNDGSVDTDFYSCIRVVAGTAADEGGNAQLLGAGAAALPSASGGGGFPHIWIPTSGMDTEVLDKTVITFHCRVGVVSNAVTCDGKWFIGFAEVGDTSILTTTTGVITIASTGALFGFHFNADSQDTLRFVSHRTAATVMATTVNFLELTDGIDVGYTAGHPRVFDLSFRLIVNNMSDNANNGISAAAWREVGGQVNPGNEGINLPGEGYAPYNLTALLDNQTPNSGTMLVPTIELMNGPTNHTQLKLDSWSMGLSRYTLKPPRVDNF